MPPGDASGYRIRETPLTGAEGVGLVHATCHAAQTPLERLNAFAARMHELRPDEIGYPINQDTQLEEFYEWYASSKMYELSLNNVGDPQQPVVSDLNSHPFENEVIRFFAPLYGFSLQEAWGIVTHSGTDGNMHGMYFGAKRLLQETKRLPICYVSEEAHYSVRRLADLQNLEIRLIPCDELGRMSIDALEKRLDVTKPALIVIAMGTTFKGAIDDQVHIEALLRKHKPIAVYRHLDAALFGGYLPFTEHRDLVDHSRTFFDSIAVSGHKFFGFDEPMGLFLTTKKTMKATNPFNVSYLHEAVPTLTCSRNGVSPLKFWWKIQKTGLEGFQAQAKEILAVAHYLKESLSRVGYKSWRNSYSNTVYFTRPSESVMQIFGLAPDYDLRLGGDLAHIVVMQHITRGVIDRFVASLALESTRSFLKPVA